MIYIYIYTKSNFLFIVSSLNIDIGHAPFPRIDHLLIAMGVYPANRFTSFKTNGGVTFTPNIILKRDK